MPLRNKTILVTVTPLSPHFLENRILPIVSKLASLFYPQQFFPDDFGPSDEDVDTFGQTLEFHGAFPEVLGRGGSPILNQKLQPVSKRWETSYKEPFVEDDVTGESLMNVFKEQIFTFFRHNKSIQKLWQGRSSDLWGRESVPSDCQQTKCIVNPSP